VNKKLVLIIVIALFGLCLQSGWSQPRVSATVSPQSGNMDDQYVFTVQIDGLQQSEYPVLEGGEDFEIMQIGPQSSLQIINGQVSAQIAYLYRLTPKKTGELQSPRARLEINGRQYQTEPVTVQVSTQRAPLPSGAADNKISYTFDLNKARVFRGEQIIGTLELVSRYPFEQLNFGASAFDGFWNQELGELQQGTRTIRGEPTRVVRRRLLLYPLRSGKLSIAEQTLKLVVHEPVRRRSGSGGVFNWDPFGNDIFGLFGYQETERSLRTDAKELEVEELPAPPATLKSDFKLSTPIVGKTELKLTFDRSPINFGESKTATYTIVSTANLNPIKELPLQLPTTVKIYNDPSTTNYNESTDSVIQKKEFKLSIVPQVGGTIEIPALHLLYFDPVMGEYQVAESPAIQFEVHGGPKPEPTPQPTLTAASPNQNGRNVLPYQEETGLEKFQNELSTPLLMLLVTFGIALVAFILIFRRLRPNYRRQQLKKALASATNFDTLNLAFRRILTALLVSECETLSFEELRALVRRHSFKKALETELLALIDMFEMVQYGGNTALASREFATREFATREFETVRRRCQAICD
jgi:hypothetical protein